MIADDFVCWRTAPAASPGLRRPGDRPQIWPADAVLGVICWSGAAGVWRSAPSPAKLFMSPPRHHTGSARARAAVQERARHEFHRSAALYCRSTTPSAAGIFAPPPRKTLIANQDNGAGISRALGCRTISRSGRSRRERYWGNAAADLDFRRRQAHGVHRLAWPSWSRRPSCTPEGPRPVPAS